MASTHKIERMGKNSGRKAMNVYKTIDSGKKGKPARGRNNSPFELERQMDSLV